MISPHTAPGTKVVAIHETNGMLPKLKVGTLYTVVEILPVPARACGDPSVKFGVRVYEVAQSIWGYAVYGTGAFDYPVLPESLTSLLKTQPVLEDA